MRRVSIKFGGALQEVNRRKGDMPTWTVDVQKVQSINTQVDRIVSDELLIDVPTRFIKMIPGDRLQIETSQKESKNADCVLRGIAYASDGGSSILSCGGMLCKLPIKLSEDDALYILLTKSRRRRRVKQSSA